MKVNERYRYTILWSIWATAGDIGGVELSLIMKGKNEGTAYKKQYVYMFNVFFALNCLCLEMERANFALVFPIQSGSRFLILLVINLIYN